MTQPWMRRESHKMGHLRLEGPHSCYLPTGLETPLPRWKKTFFCGMYRTKRMQLDSPPIFCGDIRSEHHTLGPSLNAEFAYVAEGAEPEPWIFLLQPCSGIFTRVPLDGPPRSLMADTPAILAAPQGTRLVTWGDSACGTLVARNKGSHRPSSLASIFRTPAFATSSHRCHRPVIGVSPSSLTAQLVTNALASTGHK